MILTVLSYPKHYHITQISIKKAIKHIPNISSVCVVWDDTHTEKPSAPLNEVLEISIPVYVYPWSAILQDLPKMNGWLGQQLIKLHLDKVIKKETVILDGDLLINQDIDPKNILYANALPRQHGKFKHINEILGLGAYDFGSCPFMYVDPVWLSNIRLLCETHCHDTLINRFILHQTPFLNEWDLIATYVTQVLKLPKKTEYFNRKALKAQNFVQNYNSYEHFVLDGEDDLPISFYKEHSVFLDTKLMQQLGYKNC